MHPTAIILLSFYLAYLYVLLYSIAATVVQNMLHRTLQ